MSQDNSITKKQKFKHLSERERYQIEILLKERKSPTDISKALGYHKRTIEREVVRGTVRLLTSELECKDVYCADTAHRKYEESGRHKGAGLKIGNDHELSRYIENRIIKDRYSPGAVIGEIRVKGLKFKTIICTKTLYNYIDKDVFINLTNKDLPVKRNKKKGTYNKVRIAHKNLRGTSIEERPEEIDKRVDYGNWEMDCVVGKQNGSGAVLLVLTERKTRQEIIRKMTDKTQQSVQEELDDLERKYGREFSKIFKSFTVDNGPEFLDFKSLERTVIKSDRQRTKIYYAHPYSSWERGTNENSNKLIRRFIPKGTDIGGLSLSEIQLIEYWINHYPRRIFGYKSAIDMAGKSVKISA
jgi:IS30 family transposase